MTTISKYKSYFIVCFSALLIYSCTSTKKQDSRINCNFSSYKSRMGLRITANITDSNDCGEWGGHEERIEIKKGWCDTFVHIYYTKLPSNCMLPEFKQPKNIQSSFQGKLSSEKEKYLIQYIEYFENHHYSGGTNSIRLEFHDSTKFNGYFVGGDMKELTKYQDFRDQMIKQE